MVNKTKSSCLGFFPLPPLGSTAHVLFVVSSASSGRSLSCSGGVKK